MFTELLDALVWLVRAALLTGLAWGAWLCLGLDTLRVPQSARLERFATFALLLLLLTTLGVTIHG